MNLLKGLRVKFRRPVSGEYSKYKDMIFEITGGEPELIKIKGMSSIDGEVVLFVPPAKLIITIQDRGAI